MLANDSILMAVEVEAGQTHPDTNTGKYWLLYAQHKRYTKIILFHIYTPDSRSNKWRKKLAEFYVEKMQSEVPIEYIPMDYRDARNYCSTLKEIKAEIHRKAKQLLR